jgi:NifU-like protein involved in Fe-S cluster formation
MTLRLSLSIGMAEWIDGKTLDEVLDLADRHMYEEEISSTRSSEAGQGRARRAARG